VSRSNIVVFEFGGRSYEVVKEQKKWKDAAACARSRGGYLVHIDSASENAAVMYAILTTAKVSNNYTSVQDAFGLAHVWIGGIDIANENEWYWDGDHDSSGVYFWYGQGNSGSGNGYRINNRYHN